nr:tetratricopeptide repeat protein [Psychrobacter sp. PraFG1]UNK05271.1 tetratricopeptide repeat protein [Psychrobacter sp. PraFG1]
MDDSLPLQQQVLQLAPHAYYPYAAYAQMLISNEVTFEDVQPVYHYQAEDYQAIIAVSHTALEKLERLNQSQSDGSEFIFYNNIAYAYAKLGDYLQAFAYFEKSESHIKVLINGGNSQYVEPILNDHLYSVLLNKIRLHILMGNKQQALNLLKDANNNEASDTLDLADLYAQIGEYDRANNLVQTENVDVSWGWIWYAIYNSDKQNWQQKLSRNCIRSRRYY